MAGGAQELKTDNPGKLRNIYVSEYRPFARPVNINGVELAPSVPFGGYKRSGIGREGGPEGLAAFLETKSVFMPAPSGGAH